MAASVMELINVIVRRQPTAESDAMMVRAMYHIVGYVVSFFVVKTLLQFHVEPPRAETVVFVVTLQPPLVIVRWHCKFMIG
jgi:hypothetical protein